jgi:hypothetical protein
MSHATLQKLERQIPTEQELDEQEQRSESKPFLRLTVVVDADFLDKALVMRCLESCYVPENGIDQEYIEWNTSWTYSDSAKELTDHLVSRKIPKDKPLLIKV